MHETVMRLEALCSAQTTSERADAFTELIRWMLSDGRENCEQLRQTTVCLENDPLLRQRFQHALNDLFAEFEIVDLLGTLGVPSGRGLFAELAQRFMRRFLPTSHNESDLVAVLRSVIRGSASLAQVRAVPEALFGRFVYVCIMHTTPNHFQNTRSGFVDAFKLLSTRVCNECFAPAFRRRMPAMPLSKTPFYQQAQSAEKLTQAWLRKEPLDETFKEWSDYVLECRFIAQRVMQNMQSEAIGVDIVFSVETIERCLRRLERMAELITAPNHEIWQQRLQHLCFDLAECAFEELSIRRPLRDNLNLLHHKIIGRAGTIGEHYIAETKSDYRHLWVAAAGGGIVTTVTAIVKVLIVSLHLPLFLEGVLASVNYALSFLVLGAFGFVLATKQPAMTGATLALILRERSKRSIDQIVETIVQTVRSQIAAAVGNLLVVTLCVTTLALLWNFWMPFPFIASPKAEAIIKGMSPVHSATAWYAVVTGIVLFLASLCGGWFDNWVRFNRIPQGLRLRFEHASRFGALGTRFANQLEQKAASWATSIALGCLLGFTPVMGQFLGLPLEVRHVTLNTGILAIGLNFASATVIGSFLSYALVGIFVMFILNLSVSFALALGTALRAFGVPYSAISDIVFRLLRRLVRRPWDFLIPRYPAQAAPLHGAALSELAETHQKPQKAP